MRNSSLNPNTNQYEQMRKFCRIFFLAFAAIGSLVFYYWGYSLLGGVGLSASLFSLVSFFHFNKVVERKAKHLDTKMTWFLLAVVFVGILLILGNKMQEGPQFYYGIGGGMTLVGGIAYCIELLFTWLANVK